MTLILFSILLWGATLLMAWLAFSQKNGTLTEGIKDAARELIFIAPRLIVGVLSAGFVAALLPGDLVSKFLGTDSGILGLFLATVLGIVVPGGPVVAFAIAATAYEAGGGAGQIMAFVMSWLLMSSTRTLVWEVPIMGAPFVILRHIISLPFPIVIGWFIIYLAM